MGISLEVATHNEMPYRIEMTLECEAASQMFCRGFEKFSEPDGYIACHSAAMRAGWLERQTDQGRAWVCPTCSGK